MTHDRAVAICNATADYYNAPPFVHGETLFEFLERRIRELGEETMRRDEEIAERLRELCDL
jgi:hypothetical protein